MVKLVGILNVTPDSFSDGGLYTTPRQALAKARQLFDDGAVVVDVGAESTRPQAEQITPEQEWQRLKNILPDLLETYPGRISLDSHNVETITNAYLLAPVIINDVTGLNNPKMVQLVIDLNSKVIISHLPGNDIQSAHKQVPVTTIDQVVNDLLERKAALVAQGLDPKNIIIDPGIGFGKTMDLNRQLLEFAKYVPGHPVMIGYSRKRFLGDNRMELEPNLAAGKIAATAGAEYLRVHDVAGHRPLIDSLK